MRLFSLACLLAAGSALGHAQSPGDLVKIDILICGDGDYSYDNEDGSIRWGGGVSANDFMDIDAWGRDTGTGVDITRYDFDGLKLPASGYWSFDDPLGEGVSLWESYSDHESGWNPWDGNWSYDSQYDFSIGGGWPSLPWWAQSYGPSGPGALGSSYDYENWVSSEGWSNGFEYFDFQVVHVYGPYVATPAPAAALPFALALLRRRKR
jgi:hypothetical protein